MKIYKNIFFTLLFLYKKISNDKDIIIYPYILLSALISFNIWSVIEIIKYYYFDIFKMVAYELFAIFGIVLLLNYFILLYSKEKRKKQYKKFVLTKTRISSILVVVYIVLTLFVLICIAHKHREKNINTKYIHEKTPISQVCALNPQV